MQPKDQEKKSLFRNLAYCILSNEITDTELSQFLTSTKPMGAYWILYHVENATQINIGLDISAIIQQFVLNLQTYHLSAPYNVPYLQYNAHYPTKCTVSFWCRPQKLQQYQTMVSCEPNDSTQTHFGWGFRFRRSNKFMFYFMHGHGYGKFDGLESKTELDWKTVNRWYHICGTYDSEQGKAALFVNGECENSFDFSNSDTSLPLTWNTKCGIQIGSLASNIGEAFGGHIYDFAMYSTVLSAEEIRGGFRALGMNQSGDYAQFAVAQSQDLVHWKLQNTKDEQQASNIEWCSDAVDRQTSKYVHMMELDTNLTTRHTVETRNHYQYEKWMDLNSNYVRFAVCARNDAHVALGSDKKHDAKHWEIVLGGWANAASVIRKKNQGAAQSTHRQRGLLHAQQFKTFWIQWDPDRDLCVGIGEIVGDEESVILRCPFDKALPIKCMSVATGWGATGLWQIYGVNQ